MMIPFSVVGTCLIIAAGAASTALAHTMDAHTVVSPEEIEWSPGLLRSRLEQRR